MARRQPFSDLAITSLGLRYASTPPIAQLVQAYIIRLSPLTSLGSCLFDPRMKPTAFPSNFLICIRSLRLSRQASLKVPACNGNSADRPRYGLQPSLLTTVAAGQPTRWTASQLYGFPVRSRSVSDDNTVETTRRWCTALPPDHDRCGIQAHPNPRLGAACSVGKEKMPTH